MLVSAELVAMQPGVHAHALSRFIHRSAQEVHSYSSSFCTTHNKNQQSSSTKTTTAASQPTRLREPPPLATLHLHENRSTMAFVNAPSFPTNFHDADSATDDNTAPNIILGSDNLVNHGSGIVANRNSQFSPCSTSQMVSSTLTLARPAPSSSMAPSLRVLCTWEISHWVSTPK